MVKLNETIQFWVIGYTLLVNRKKLKLQQWERLPAAMLSAGSIHLFAAGSRSHILSKF